MHSLTVAALHDIAATCVGHHTVCQKGLMTPALQHVTGYQQVEPPDVVSDKIRCYQRPEPSLDDRNRSFRRGELDPQAEKYP